MFKRSVYALYNLSPPIAGLKYVLSIYESPRPLDDKVENAKARAPDSSNVRKRKGLTSAELDPKRSYFT